MNIYHPYVYIVTHRQDGSYYFGMRSAHRTSPEEDLGVHYFTSNKRIQRNFHEYETQVIAVFLSWEDAFTFENEMIERHWGDPLLLNHHFQRNPSSFSLKGFRRPDVSALNSKLKKKPKELRTFSCRECGSRIEKHEFVHHAPAEHYYCNTKCRNIFFGRLRQGHNISEETRQKLRGRNISEETRQKLSEAHKGKEPWNKGKSCPQISEACKGRTAWNKGKPSPASAENGRKSAKKQSQTVTGRKRRNRDDGSWFWVYPNDDGTYSPRK